MSAVVATSFAANTPIGDGSIPLPENANPSSFLVAPVLLTHRRNGARRVKDAPTSAPKDALNERRKWLSVLQDDAAHYQKNGGRVLVTERDGFLVVAFPNVVRCVKCNDWLISGNACERCLAEYGLPETSGS